MIAAWLLWLILAMHFDFNHRRVPNWLVLGGLTAAALSLVLDRQPFGISGGDALTGAVAAFLVMLICYAAGWMGAGDVKFAAALGLWVGLPPLLPIWIGAALLAGMHATLWALLLRWPYFPRLFAAMSGRPGPASHPDNEAGQPERQRHVPLAAYLALASVFWLTARNAAP